MQRRRVLEAAWLGGVAAALPGLVRATSATAARAAPAMRFVAAWSDEAGGNHQLGVLAVRGNTLRVLSAIALPTRAHGLLLEPGGSVLAAARRPGDWLLRWAPANGAASWFWSESDRRFTAPAAGAASWFWGESDRRFTGHLLRDPAGRCLYSAETDLASGQGLIAVRDARTLALQAEWLTHGIDPHQFIVDADGSLLVANGGVPTLPETGRAKHDLDRMDASLVRLDGRSGALLGQWRLADARLSIRHLVRDAAGTVGIALQAEHDDAQAKANAPVLALFDGQALRTAELPQALAGYGGDIAATADGFAIGVPRAGGVAHWRRDGQWVGFTPLAEACALAAVDGGIWVGGRDQVMACAGADEPRRLDLAALRLDNHWLALPAR